MPDTPKRRQVETAPSADRATAAAGNPGETGRGNGGVAAAAGEAGEKAREWTHEAKHRGRRMLDEQKHNVAEQIAGVAQALHKSAGECLEREDQRTAGRVLEQAATALDRLSDTLRDRDLNAMLDQATDLMRRQPAWFIAGSVAAGFLLTRFAASSRRRPAASSYAESGYQGAGDSMDRQGSSPDASYVAGAHADPGEIGRNGRGIVPPAMPSGRRDY